ncbi:hypothetical protein Q5P01_016908 [Channa striata]|uniref:EF-hand domain-containing protein n=1 Tax=Channa striata TaxID=64152 RepID=A0AA88M8E1_CHASR|nr:hypothetical protein Q5P01_016908 [Channa striata]
MKKKKQRPRKPTPKKTKKVSTDKTHKASTSKGPELDSFLDELIGWFSDHQEKLDQLFDLSDTDRNGTVNLKAFELGLMNLDVPCQQSQLHTLTQLLKNANNMISYRDLNGQVQRLRSSDGSTQMSEEDFSQRQQAAEKGGVERNAQDQLLQPKNDRFICLRVRLIPFDMFGAHPGNFEVVLSSRSKVYRLIQIIQDHVGMQTSRLEVFRSRRSTENDCLPPENTLEECGFEGGTEECPVDSTVYYDYRLPFTDCPLLNCDHYFSSAARTTRYH